MTLKNISEVESQDEARQIAIDWQNWATQQDGDNGEDGISYGELAEYQVYFEELAEKFDLVEEFKENGII